MRKRAQIFRKNGIKKHVLHPKKVSHAMFRVEFAFTVPVHEFRPLCKVLLERDIGSNTERSVKTRRVVLPRFVGVDDAYQIVPVGIALSQKEVVVRNEPRKYRAEKCRVGKLAMYLENCVREHRRLRERARAFDAPAKKVENARRPINDVRHHAVRELTREERAYLRFRRFRLELRQNDGVKTRIPQPLVRVVVARRNGVLMVARHTAIFCQQFPSLAYDVHMTLSSSNYLLSAGAQISMTASSSGRCGTAAYAIPPYASRSARSVSALTPGSFDTVFASARSASVNSTARASARSGAKRMRSTTRMR